MRYEAKQTELLYRDKEGQLRSYEWGVWDNEKQHFIVADDGLLLESAAHIIADTLNAVARGDNVYYAPRVWQGDVPYGDAKYTRYSGPVQGVSRG